MNTGAKFFSSSVRWRRRHQRYYCGVFAWRSCFCCANCCLLPASVSRAKNNLVFIASLGHSEWSSGLFCCKYIHTTSLRHLKGDRRDKGNIPPTRKSVQSRACNSFLWRLISFSLQIISDNISSRCFITSMALCSSKSSSSVTWLWPLKVTTVSADSNQVSQTWLLAKSGYFAFLGILWNLKCGVKKANE